MACLGCLDMVSPSVTSCAVCTKHSAILVFRQSPQDSVARLCASMGLNCTAETVTSISCGSVPSLPTLHITVAGQDLPLTPQQYVVETRAKGGPSCVLGITGSRSVNSLIGSYW